jgi:hypothetical protein
MEQFRIRVADNRGSGQFFNIKTLDNEHYQILNDQLERLATIEIDLEDHRNYRQSLYCKIDRSLLEAIKDSILLHSSLAEG